MTLKFSFCFTGALAQCWYNFPAGAASSDVSLAMVAIDATTGQAVRVCSMPQPEQEAMQADSLAQIAEVAALLLQAQDSLQAAKTEGKDELATALVLEAYPVLLHARRTWISAFQQTSQLLQAGAVLHQPQSVAQLLNQGFKTLQLMEVARIALGVSLPTMRSEVAKDQQELRRLLREVSWEHLPEGMQAVMEVSWRLQVHPLAQHHVKWCSQPLLQKQSILQLPRAARVSKTQTSSKLFDFVEGVRQVVGF